MPTLLDQFLQQEATPFVRGLLKDELTTTTRLVSRFEFNRFEVTLDREHGVAVLEDVLDVTEAGAMTMPLREFVEALDRDREPPEGAR